MLTPSSALKVLVVGSGGREHALCLAAHRSPLCAALFCAPGNAGIDDLATCIDIAADDIDGLVTFVQEHGITFVIVGPEAALVLGLVDRLEAIGVPAFGPSQAAAELEKSKGFMKDLCQKYSIPTARYARFDNLDKARDWIRTQGAPIVVKADGLAGGKGVTVAMTEDAALNAVEQALNGSAFGAAGAEVVIEDFMDGEEVSFFVLSDGEQVLPLTSAQDHKRLNDGDHGPNTGGMGCYSPTSLMTPALCETVLDRIIQPTLAAMKAEGRPYRGVLYAGLILTAEGRNWLNTTSVSVIPNARRSACGRNRICSLCSMQQRGVICLKPTWIGTMTAPSSSSWPPRATREKLSKTHGSQVSNRRNKTTM